MDVVPDILEPKGLRHESRPHRVADAERRKAIDVSQRQACIIYRGSDRLHGQRERTDSGIATELGGANSSDCYSIFDVIHANDTSQAAMGQPQSGRAAT